MIDWLDDPAFAGRQADSVIKGIVLIIFWFIFIFNNADAPCWDTFDRVATPAERDCGLQESAWSEAEFYAPCSIVA